MSDEYVFNRDDALVLKKKLEAVNKENRELKVKLTKSLDDIRKKDEEIEKLLDPNESTLFVEKAAYENKAAGFMNMKKANKKLEAILLKKVATIKKLQNDLQVVKIYSRPFYNVSYKGSSHYLPRNIKSRNLKSKSSLSSSRTSMRSASTEKVQVYSPHDDSTKHQLFSIIDNFLNAQLNTLSNDIRKKVFPESDLERNEPTGTLSRDEFMELESYFLDVLKEVDNINVMVSNLQSQKNTVDLVEESSNGKKPKQLEKSKTLVHPSDSQQSSSINNTKSIKNLDKTQSCKKKEKSP